MNNIITDDELNQFRSLPVQKIVDSMEAYLIGINGHKYKMKEVGARVFGDENYSFTVSLIHRCYNFSGQNGGKYSNGCKFEKNYGYRVTRQDIEAFVKKYPMGTYSLGITFEDFLLTRVKSAKAQGTKPQAPKPQTIHRTNPSQYREPDNSYIYGDNQGDDAKAPIVMLGIGCVGVLVLLILLFTGNLFEHWVISLVVLFLTIGGFSSFSILKEDGSQGYQARYPEYKSQGKTQKSSRIHKTSKVHSSGMAQKALIGIESKISNWLRGKSLSSILTTIFVLVLIVKFSISYFITQEPISTRFWALYIALATTKGMVFDAKEFGLFGKAIILGIVWLTAYNFL
jgi:hypothetical protein